MAFVEKSQQYTNNFGSVLYISIGNTVFPTPQPISNILQPSLHGRSRIFMCLSPRILSCLVSAALIGFSVSSFTVLGANSGNSISNQCLSLKNLKLNCIYIYLQFIIYICTYYLIHKYNHKEKEGDLLIIVYAVKLVPIFIRFSFISYH